MSSMFKKKGGLAFKPKAPIARPRAGPSAPTTKPAPPPQPAIEVPEETIPEPVSDNTEKLSDSREVQSKGSGISVEEPKETEKEAPPTPSRRSTRRASQSQQSKPSSQPRLQTEDSIAEGDFAVATTVDESSNAESLPQTTPSTRTRRQSAAKPLPKPSIETPQQPTPEPTPADHVAAPKVTESVAESQSASGTTSEEPAPAPPSRTSARATAKKPSAATEDVTTSAAEGEPTRPKKRQRKTSRQDDGTEAPAPRKRKTSTPNANGSRSSSRRARSLTPDDAEDQVVDLQKLKMSDLTKDLRIGKKFSRHDELRDRERQARLKAKLEKDGDTPSEAGVDGTQSPAPDSTNGSTTKPKSGTPGSTSTPTASAAAAAAAAAATSGPQFRIVDGQIVVDQSSLVMDRHARAAAARGNQDMETIEENDFTRLITSSSFMNTSKLKGPNIWTDPETELFYRGLRMFGTEFEMISKMFPGKQRRHIKLKYNREERHNPKRIDAAVMGVKTIKMDIDEYRAFTGAEYESVETIEAEQRKIQEGYEAERQRIVDEQAEIMRKKKEELFADEDGEEGDFKKKRKGKRKGKQTVQYGLNGEPITGD